MFDFGRCARASGPKRVRNCVGVGVFSILLAISPARAEKIALVGATVINPADGKVLPNATVVINGDKIG